MSVKGESSVRRREIKKVGEYKELVGVEGGRSGVSVLAVNKTPPNLRFPSISPRTGGEWLSRFVVSDVFYPGLGLFNSVKGVLVAFHSLSFDCIWSFCDWRSACQGLTHSA